MWQKFIGMEIKSDPLYRYSCLVELVYYEYVATVAVGENDNGSIK